MDSEVHTVILSVQIQRVNFSVRFPCSLVFLLKEENKTIESRSSYELLNGSCTPKETLRIETTLQKRDQSSYRDKNIKLVIVMVTSNGKIPAGSVSINAGNLKLNKSQTQTSQIDKCHDRSANVEYTSSIQFVSQSANNSRSQGSLYQKLEHDSGIRRSRLHPSTLAGSLANRPSLDKVGLKKYFENKDRSVGIGTTDRKNFDNSRGSEISGKGNDESLNKRVFSLEKQKSEYLREISKLKGELTTQLAFQRTGNEQLLDRLRAQIELLNQDNDLLKNENKKLERREREHLQNIKELRENLERRKQKNSQQEIIKLQSQSLLHQKQKLMKQMQAELKKYEEEISELKINLSTQQKRLQFKENNFKEQFTKLNQKYQQSQNQRQKAVLELNNMLEELETVQKKNQLNWKEKDRTVAEDKNRLLKKNENLNRQIQHYKQILEEKDNKITDLQREVKHLQSELKSTEEDLSSFKADSRNLNSTLLKESDAKKNLLKEMEELQEIATQHNILKKRHLQLEQKDSATKRNLEKTQKDMAHLQATLKKTEEELRAKSIEINQYKTKISTMDNQIEVFRKEEENYNREAQTLSMNNLNAASKIQELKGRIDQLQMNYNELETASEEKIGYLIKSKEYLQTELEQSKWSCQKTQENYDQMATKNKLLNEEILVLNKKSLGYEEQISKLQEQIYELKTDRTLLSQQKNQLHVKQRQFQQKLKEKADENHDLQKKINKLQTEYFMAVEKNRHNEKYYLDKVHAEETENKSKEDRLSEAAETINILQLQLLNKNDNINSLKNDYERLKSEVAYLTDQQEILKRQSLNLQARITQLNENVNKLEEDLFDKSEQLENEKQSKAKLLKTSTKTSREWEQYRSTTQKAVQQLLQEIGKDLSSGSVELLSFPDDNLANLQVQAIKKRNSLLEKYQQNNNSLNNQIRGMQEQMERIKNHHQQREEELQSIISEQKTKSKNLLSQSTGQKAQLMENISNLEDNVHQLTSQCEHLNIEVKDCKETIEGLQDMLQNKMNEVGELTKEVQGLKDQIKILGERHKQEKDQLGDQMDNLNNELTVQIDKLKKQVQEGERKNQNLEQALQQKDSTIEKLQTSLNQLTYQRDNKEQMLVEINNRYVDLIHEHKANLQVGKDTQKTVNQLQDKISELETANSHLQRKIEEMTIQKKKVEEALSAEQKQKMRLGNALELAQENLKNTEESFRQAGEKNKKYSEKNNQEIKKLKEDIIKLNSEIDLKVFLIEQLENNLKDLKLTNSDAAQEINSKKNEVVNLQTNIQDLRNQNILLKQNLETTKGQRDSFQEELRGYKQVLTNTQAMLQESQVQADLVAARERQLCKLKEEMSHKGKDSEKTLKELQHQIEELKMEITIRTQNEEQYKDNIRELEKELEEQNNGIEAERKNWQENSSNEQKKIKQQIDSMKSQNKNLTSQFENHKKELNKQLAQAQKENKRLEGIIKKQQKSLDQSSNKKDSDLNRIKTLEQELRECKQEWQKERKLMVPTNKQFQDLKNQVARYQKYSTQLEAKNKQLIEVGKRKMAEEPKATVGEVLREVSTIILRNKARIIGKCPTEREKELAITDFKVIQQKLENAIRSQSIVR